MERKPTQTQKRLSNACFIILLICMVYLQGDFVVVGVKGAVLYYQTDIANRLSYGIFANNYTSGNAVGVLVALFFTLTVPATSR
jgi:hypothetical protein